MYVYLCLGQLIVFIFGAVCVACSGSQNSWMMQTSDQSSLVGWLIDQSSVVAHPRGVQLWSQREEAGQNRQRKTQGKDKMKRDETNAVQEEKTENKKQKIWEEGQEKSKRRNHPINQSNGNDRSSDKKQDTWNRK